MQGGNKQNYHSQYEDTNFWVTDFFNVFGAIHKIMITVFIL